MALKMGRQVSSANLTVAGSVIPPGVTAPFTGSTAPNGWLLCNGAAYSRTVFAALFAVIGTTHGSGDGVTTFNVPDDQGQTIRGHVGITNTTGSGTVVTNNATFTAHGINRTGFKVRLLSGTVTGIGTGVTYFAIVIDPNTLAFATTYANALAGTKIAISGVVTGTITQWEDPDQTSRLLSAPGASSVGSMGSRQDDNTRGHTHTMRMSNNYGGNPDSLVATSGGSGGNNGVSGGTGVSNSSTTGGNETRVANLTRNSIIKT